MNQCLTSDRTKLIKANYERVLENVNRAATKSGRSLADIRVVVVTKAHPIEVVQAAAQAGILVFGENYPEEALPKINAIGDPSLEWHMIGHLQSRKAKIVAEHFHWFHALDNLKLADKLNRELAARDKKMPVLLEFNVGGEESKAGWNAAQPEEWTQLTEIIERLFSYSYFMICGLMTMPPLETDPEKAREYFIKLRKLRDYLEQQIPELQLPELSMGTSLDYELAVEEGATMVRIGQAILGPRPEK